MKKYYMLMMILLGCLGFLTAQNYRVGDVYTAPDGSKGVVFYIFPNGTGGWVVALDDASANCAWGDASDISALEDHEGLYVQLLLADTSGYANTLAIRNQQNNSGYAAGVVDFAHGWYLPSSGQLRMLHAKKPMLDPVLEVAGGSPFANGWYWSSAEKDAGTAWRVDFGDAVYHGRFNPTSKSDLCHVRAVRTFTYEPAYLWSTGDTTAAVTVIPDETMDYTVTVYGPAGCSGTDAFHLTVVQGTHNAETAVACGSYEWNGAIYTISGTYTYDYTNAEGCSSTDTLHLTVHHSTHNVLDTVVCDSYTWTEGTGETYSISGVYTYAYNDANDCASIDTLYLTIIPMSVLNHAQDTVIIEGTSATLWVSGAEFPVWMNMEGEQLGSGNTLSVTPSVSTAYLVSNFAEGQNLVYNGDFEAGNTGFATDYIYGNTGSHDHYYVGHDIAEMWPWDSPGFPVRDHTSGNGQFLMVDGALQMNTTVWSQSIPVTPHTDYLFSAWLLTDNIAYFKYEINGVQTGIDYSTPETEWIWERYSQVWNSGTDTVAVVKIINRYSYSAGYDYAIDDITFTPLTECSVTDTIHVIVTGYPDNVDSADCTFLPEGTEWGIDQPLISSATALTVTTPMVGDIDDDGNQEILIPDGYYNMSVFRADGSLKSQFHIAGMPGGRAIGSIGLAKVKWQEGEFKNIIVVFGTNKHIYAYDANGIQLWQTAQAFSSYNGENDPLPTISFADFNHDGWTEVYVGGEIYDAATGIFLCKAMGNKGFAGRTWDTQANPYQTIAADLYGDNTLEMAIGNAVYAVDIQSRIDASLNQVTVVRQLPPSVMLMEDNSTIPFTDGNTSLIDINKDGRLDVLVMNVDQANRVVYCYIWDVETQTIICSKKIPNARKFGCPQMGDLDNDGNAEVCFMTGTYSGHGTGANDLIYALKYNELNSNREMDVFWTVSHGDNSACTGLTLFDFNQDGYAELVYRDISYLRIINGSLHHHQTGEVVSQPYDMAVYPCRSNTQIEYPIVVDVDGDGEAEIITSGANSMTDYGHVYIFKSAGEPWAPARKVWNQYMYNVTNVNEDLTIPQYQFNNALAFTDPEGVVRRPYNNFLQQATTIDQYGRPFYAVADVAMEASAFSQMQGNDTLALTFSYCNQGDNMLNAPYTVTIFANAYGSDTVCTFMVSESLPVDSCVQTNMSIPVSALCGFPNIDSLVIAVNCAGTGIAQNGGQQPECDTTNNTAAVAITLRSDTAYLSETACNSYFWYGDLLTQSGEYTHTLSNATGCVSVEVLNLTIIPMPTLRHTQDTVILAGTSATLWATGADYIYWTDDNDSLLYSGNTLVVNPETTTTYYLGGQNEPGCSVTDTIHVIVTGYPDNVDSADCVFFPEGTEWGIGQPLVSSASAITVTTPMVGDIDDDGQQEVVCPAGSSSVVSRINIFNADATLKSYFNTVGFYIWNSVGLAKVKWQGNEYKNIIVVLGTNKRLYAYDAQGTQLWQSNAAFQVNESTPLPAISFADFNHDGWTEIYIGGDIYDAATGVLLSRASGNKGYSGRTWSTQNNVYHTVVADFFGDCDLELVAGNTIYSVDIQSRTDFNANQMTVVKEVPPAAMKMEDNSSIPFTDGNTYLADMNLDGRLDVLVMNVDQSSRVVYLYVWDVETQSIICSKKIANARKFGTPQIGDINQDGYDEVCFIIGTYSDHSTGNNDLIYALQYNPQNSNGELDVFWTTSHSDNSACTGLTLFDFNQDGIAELVYRDRFNLRIINGSLIHHQTGEAVTQPYDIAVSPCGSATGIEYPLVVDVDLDGEAEIVVGG
ncbi:MAG: hypothetical protein J6X16_01040, partial [Bacteroidales bacterium]|nr:hypothetical protein [Bacteroidales bacterium]